MAQIPILILAVAATACIIASTPFTAGGADNEGSPIFGVKIPPGYRDWRLISVAHEEGNLNDLRAILGNDVAIKASREGRPNVESAHARRPIARPMDLTQVTS